MLAKLESFRDDMSRGIARASLVERFKFTRDERGRLVAMAKIREANRNLERLLLSSFIGEMYDQQRSIPMGRGRERLRRMSEPLFRKLDDKLNVPCPIHGVHEARVCLWNCCSHQRQSRSSDSLDLVLSVTKVGETGSYWQEILILTGCLG